MALNIKVKKNVVKQVNELAINSISVGVAEYKGLTVTQMTNLRLAADEADVCLRVVKNTLAKKALVNSANACVLPLLSGQVVLGFSQNDAGAVARVFADFLKDNKILVVKGFAVAGKFLGKEQLKSIALLPTKEQAINKLMVCMLAPIKKLCRVFNDIPTKLVRVFSEIHKQKKIINKE